MWPWLASVYMVLGVPRGSAACGCSRRCRSAGWSPRSGRAATAPPARAGWFARSRDDADSWIDERMISQALAHLGITPLDRFFKNGGELVYTVPARVDGEGTYAQIRMPMGATADMVAAKRTTLAANLGRATLETWPTQGEEAGILELWIADKGKLGGGAGPWPLLHEGTVDVFEGVPIGKTQRGQIIYGHFFERNWIVGGRPGQGKTALVRILVLGAALDPTAELWVFVIAQNTDFAPFAPRLTRYQVGMGPDVAAAAVQALADLFAEMERRGKLLATLPGSPPATSRRLADKPALGLHPLICVISECHELFGHPTHGEQAEKLAISVIKQGRKFGITLILDTQSPTATSIPKEVTRNTSCGVAFSVADHIANDGLLGSGKYRAGIRATDLRMHTDRGTSVMVGVSDATFELVRGFYVPYADGVDMVTPVVTRAMTTIDQLRCTGPHHRRGQPGRRGRARSTTWPTSTRRCGGTASTHSGGADPAGRTQPGRSMRAGPSKTSARRWPTTTSSRSNPAESKSSEPPTSPTHSPTVTATATQRVTHEEGPEVGTRPGTRGVLPTPHPHPCLPNLTSPNHHQGPTPSRAQQRRKPRKTGLGAATGGVPPSPNPSPTHPRPITKGD